MLSLGIIWKSAVPDRPLYI